MVEVFSWPLATSAATTAARSPLPPLRVIRSVRPINAKGLTWERKATGGELSIHLRLLQHGSTQNPKGESKTLLK